MTKQSSSQAMAIVSLVLGILAILTFAVLFIPVVFGVLAIIFGILSRKTSGRGKAIAGIVTGSIGIVFSIVFVAVVLTALPALQQNQRDSIRKNDVSSMMTEITTYQSNNRGVLPSASDISTIDLSLLYAIDDEGQPTTDTAVYRVGFNCDGEEVSARSYSVSVLLENDATYCIDS